MNTALKSKVTKSVIFASSVLVGLAFTGTAFAQGVPTPSTASTTGHGPWGNHMMGRGMGKWMHATSTLSRMPHASSTPSVIIPGNGEPVIGGKVTAVSGATVTVATATGNVTYSVDASNATIEKNATTTTAASITVGDSVLVQGTVNGTTVVASSVLDSGVSKAPGMGNKFMGAVGGFFKHIFGFF